MFTNIFGKRFDKENNKQPKQYANDYEEYKYMKRGNFIRYDQPLEISIPANEICGIFDRDNKYFWNHHSNCKEDYINLAKLMCEGDEQAMIDFYSPPIKIYKFKSIYILSGDGRHRVCATQELKIAINVLIEGEYEKIE